MAENNNQDAPKKKPLNLVLLGLIAFALINLGLVGTGAYLTYKSTIGWSHPIITEADAERQDDQKIQDNSSQVQLLYTMDKFTVNLDGEPRRTLRVEVNLEMLNKNGYEEVMEHDLRARAKDRIVQILNSKKFADVESIQGKLFLKDQIATEINSLLHDGVVRDVYFSEFVAQ